MEKERERTQLGGGKSSGEGWVFQTVTEKGAQIKKVSRQQKTGCWNHEICEITGVI